MFDGEDLNNLTDTNLMLGIASGTNVKNAPISGITVFNVEHVWGIIQVAIKYNSPVIYARVLFTNLWSNWYQLNVTEIK